jgi:hypothetical protein
VKGVGFVLYLFGVETGPRKNRWGFVKFCQAWLLQNQYAIILIEHDHYQSIVTTSTWLGVFNRRGYPRPLLLRTRSPAIAILGGRKRSRGQDFEDRPFKAVLYQPLPKRRRSYNYVFLNMISSFCT